MTTSERLRSQVVRHPVLVATELICLAAAVPTLLVGGRDDVVRLASQAVQAVDGARAPAPIGRVSAAPAGQRGGLEPFVVGDDYGRWLEPRPVGKTAADAGAVSAGSAVTPTSPPGASAGRSSSTVRATAGTTAPRTTPSAPAGTPTPVARPGGGAVVTPASGRTVQVGDDALDLTPEPASTGRWSRTTFTRDSVPLEVSGPLLVVSARVRGGECAGRPPQLAWSLDGAVHATAGAAAKGWRTVRLTLPAGLAVGAHTVSLGHLTAPGSSPCEGVVTVTGLTATQGPAAPAAPTASARP